MTLCKFQRVGDQCVCRCGRVLNTPDCSRTFAECPLGEGWGSTLCDILSWCGITQQRYVGLKQRLGFEPSCECTQRINKLNRASRWLRQKRKLLLSQMMQIVRTVSRSLASWKVLIDARGLLCSAKPRKRKGYQRHHMGQWDRLQSDHSQDLARK